MLSSLVSVIVPALNEADNIAACVGAALSGCAPGEVEVIVADGGSTDGTPGSVPPGARVIQAPRGRAAQMNHGAAAARGEVLVFCHADTRLPPGWRSAVLVALERPGVSGGAFQIAIVPAFSVFHLINRLRLPAAWWALYGDQGLFLTRATFQRVGGFPEIPLLEDVEMARALSRQGRLARLPLRVASSGRRFAEVGALRQFGRIFTILWRYHLGGDSPAELARLYRSSREGAP